MTFLEDQLKLELLILIILREDIRDLVVWTAYFLNKFL